jgi:hypothetical protein
MKKTYIVEIKFKIKEAGANRNNNTQGRYILLFQTA